MRIGSVYEEKKDLAWGRVQTRLIEQCQVPRGKGNMTRETKSWNGCADW